MHDDQFTATGPSHFSSGKQKAAFSTVDFFDDNSNPSDFEFGIHVKARRVGVVGASAKGIAGVYGHGHTCKFGVLGIAIGRKCRDRCGGSKRRQYKGYHEPQRSI